VLGLVLFYCADGGVALGELEAKLTRILIRELKSRFVILGRFSAKLGPGTVAKGSGLKNAP
jgi:hypothetical protein